MESSVKQNTSVEQLPIMALMSQYPLLKKEEERSLIIRCGQGDAEARERLILANLRLVVWVAKRSLRAAGASQFADLIAAGIVGLIKAVDRVDAKFENTFSTYATWWIKNGIVLMLEDNTRAVQLPNRYLRLLRNYGRAEEALAQKLFREPSVEEVAAELKIPIAEAFRLKEIDHSEISLEDPLHSGFDSNTAILSDMIADDSQESAIDVVAECGMQSVVQAALGILPAREREVIEHRFGFNGKPAQSLSEIGVAMGIKGERVRQIEKRALHRLRTAKMLKCKKQAYL